MQLAATAVQVFPADERPRHFYDVTWALLTACALVVVVTTAGWPGRRRPWDAAMFARAPAAGPARLDQLGPRRDGARRRGLLQWAAPAAGCRRAARRRTATKLYPVLFLVPLLALGVRAGRLRPVAVAAVATVLTPVLLSLPVYLTSPSFADVGGVQTAVAARRSTGSGTRACVRSRRRPRSSLPTARGDGRQRAYRFVELKPHASRRLGLAVVRLQTAAGGALDARTGRPTR
jgi:hypothetical protein